MRILFLHQNFPGQFQHLARALVRRGDQVAALCVENRPVPEGVRVIRYRPRRSSSPNIHPWAVGTETKLIRGQASFLVMREMQKRGYCPDIIVAHPGWGEALFAKDVWPNVPLLSYFEFYYQPGGLDAGFDPEFPEDPNELPGIRTKNFVNLMSLESCDAGIAPTHWQKSIHPRAYRDKIRVIHDGIDTDMAAPDRTALVDLPDIGLHFGAGDEIVTFVNRNLEPYRGYHIFMRALPEILRRRPKAHVLIVGGGGVSYGAPPKEGSWRDIFFAEVKAELDLGRVHFMGRIPYTEYIRLLQVSAVHVYLSYPFVLSWSLLEAMSAGTLVVASATPPVREVVAHGENGLLVDFFSPAALAEQIVAALDAPEDFAQLRREARRTIVERYDLQRICLPQQIAAVDELRR